VKRFEQRFGAFVSDELSVIITLDDNMVHLSIAHPERLPTYEELKGARYAFLDPDKTFGQLFVPKKFWVNKHPYCLHLWEIKGWKPTF